MSDASIRTKDDETNVRDGIIILFLRIVEVLHTIRWTSRLAQRVSYSTSTAELLAGADAVEKLIHFKHLHDKNLNVQIGAT